MNNTSKQYRHLSAGELVLVSPTPPGLVDSYPAADWIETNQLVELSEESITDTLDVFDVMHIYGPQDNYKMKDESIYGFNIICTTKELNTRLMSFGFFVTAIQGRLVPLFERNGIAYDFSEIRDSHINGFQEILEYCILELSKSLNRIAHLTLDINKNSDRVIANISNHIILNKYTA